MAETTPKSDDAGKQLRQMILGMTAKDVGVAPSPEFPSLFGVLMDWPVGEQIASVVALSDGTASLYTTSTFGIIGGQAHEAVRVAGRRWLQVAERFHGESSAAMGSPYPASDQVFFYLLTFGGLRLVAAPLKQVQAGEGRHAALFNAGQEVLAQLRKTVAR
jgi:hypothetical protein